MKNIEKYPNTKDALEAWRKSRWVHKKLFADWLNYEYENPHRNPTLLEAAESIVDEYANPNSRCLPYYGVMIISDLRSAIEREKRKPIRNCDVYRTADEAVAAFVAFIRINKGNEIADTTSLIDWLYAEADKEVK